MGCYVIVTCHSMLWSLLTVILTLATLYCLTSTDWLVGMERTYDNEYTVTVPTETDAEQGYNYDTDKTIVTRMYNPTIGLYSRCLRVTSSRQSVMSCGSFAGSIGASNEIFPTAWQISLVLAGVASLLQVFTMFTALMSLCVRDFCKKSVFTISGLLQVISGLILAIAVAIYPVGWSSPKLQYFCSREVTAYYKDQCTIGWAYIGIIICTVCLFPTGMLSIKADRATSKDEIEDEILKGKRLICIK